MRSLGSTCEVSLRDRCMSSDIRERRDLIEDVVGGEEKGMLRVKSPHCLRIDSFTIVKGLRKGLVQAEGWELKPCTPTQCESRTANDRPRH
ncbi:hypothetical protein EVAR_1036_1 [Eumeta japonica]|uniref:Uncharacterized protein n=1 Tax=Eumeta variegata TaxID=151549 RepID=A0A4C1SH57_EUMVA|nr:hypothetical protein EVAR_1036_1 [Eumeta japonica]